MAGNHVTRILLLILRDMRDWDISLSFFSLFFTFVLQGCICLSLSVCTSLAFSSHYCHCLFLPLTHISCSPLNKVKSDNSTTLTFPQGRGWKIRIDVVLMLKFPLKIQMMYSLDTGWVYLIKKNIFLYFYNFNHLSPNLWLRNVSNIIKESYKIGKHI